ncbi:MAG: GNAT family N-acetyltransferase [Lachnospiraceae bacterium]|nr:GNAT family N-acetyltransferase [Lachnospiraceae bacterium]
MEENNAYDEVRTALYSLSNENWPAGLVDITERLVIREFRPDEAELCREMYRECGSFMSGDNPAGLSPEEFFEFHRSYIKYQYGFYGYGNFGIFLKAPDCRSIEECIRSSGTCIGMVGLINGSASQTGELSYAILPPYRRLGYASEACAAVLEYGRECGFEQFEARISPDNTASTALAEKLGIKIIR